MERKIEYKMLKNLKKNMEIQQKVWRIILKLVYHLTRILLNYMNHLQIVM